MNSSSEELSAESLSSNIPLQKERKLLTIILKSTRKNRGLNIFA